MSGCGISSPWGWLGRAKGPCREPWAVVEAGRVLLVPPLRTWSRKKAKSSKRGAQGSGATLGVKCGLWQRVLSQNKSAQPCKNNAATLSDAHWACQGGFWHSGMGMKHLNPLPFHSWPCTPKACLARGLLEDWSSSRRVDKGTLNLPWTPVFTWAGAQESWG